MSRYLVLADRTGEGADDDLFERRGLQRVMTARGLAVGVSTTMPYMILQDGLGILLGRLFQRESTTIDVRSLASSTVGQDPETCIAFLVRHFWGSYLAILQQRDGSRSLIFRDPSGALPAYFGHSKGKLRLSNDVDLLSTAFSIDWLQLREHILTEGLRTSRTCLSGVDELLPGMALDPVEIEQRCYWTPWDYCPDPKDDRPPDAQRLRTVVNNSVAQLTTHVHRPLAFISGGLDSSVIVAALAYAGKATQCLTISTPDPSGDETVFARIVAAKFGLPLEERVHDAAYVDFASCAAAHLPMPKRRPLYQSMGHIGAEVAQACQADALITGNGGDHVFSLIQSGTTIVDCVKARRPLLEIMATIENLCALTGCSVSEALASAWRRWWRKTAYQWPLHPAFLAAVDAQPPGLHSWLSCPPSALPGKAFHVAMIVQMQDHLESPLPLSLPAMITPLMAQPVLEACLGIQSWHWIKGGQNRALIREAYADDLPPSILDRKVKAGPLSFSVGLLVRNRAKLRDLLLGGILAEQGLIDQRRIAFALDNLFLQGSEEIRRLLELTDVEAWCRHWSGRTIA